MGEAQDHPTSPDTFQVPAPGVEAGETAEQAELEQAGYDSGDVAELDEDNSAATPEDSPNR